MRFQNNEMAAVMCKANSVEVKLFSHVNAFICPNKFVWMLAKWVKTLYFATELTSVRKLTEWHSPLKFLLRGYTPLNYIYPSVLTF